MIEFYGELSDKCKIDGAKKQAKYAGILFLFTTILIGVFAIPYGIIKGTWIYAIIITMFFAIITIVASIPQIKKVLRFKIPSRLIIKDNTISITAVGGKKTMKTRQLSKVKKIIDARVIYVIC